MQSILFLQDLRLLQQLMKLKKFYNWHKLPS
jgi:hypothetical protein